MFGYVASILRKCPVVNTLLGQLADVVTFTISPVPHMALHEGVQSERCENHGARDTLRTFPQHSASFCPSHPTLLQSPGLYAGLPSASCSLPTISSRPAPMRHSGLYPVSPALTTLPPPCPSALSSSSSFFMALTKHEDFSALKSSFIPLVAHCLHLPPALALCEAGTLPSSPPVSTTRSGTL